MNELIVIAIVLATLSISYLWVYPRFAGRNVKLMAYMDIGFTFVPAAVSGLFFWQSDPVFRVFGLELNWFIYSILAYILIEIPVFILYVRARGLWPEYKAIWGSSSSADYGWSSSPASVEKSLHDERWNGLRTKGALRFLVWGNTIVILGGTIVLSLVPDSPAVFYLLIHILLIFVFWFLLRKAVRLVADAPEESLDERLLEMRNISYLWAYRWLSAIVCAIGTAALGWAIAMDYQDYSPDGWIYLVEITWGQINALFWLFAGFTFSLPSMALANYKIKHELVD